jgi:small subunit ribosomal protein S16
LAVHLRFRRVGRKKVPIYKLVAADSRAARNGKFIEAFGLYNPMAQPMEFEVKEPRLFYWLERGALPSDTVRTLLSRKGLWLRWSLMRRGIDEATISAELAKWQALQEEKLRREAERKARRALAKKKERKEKPAEAQAQPAASVEAKVDDSTRREEKKEAT